MAIQWVYANGSSWIVLHPNLQTQIEALWTRDAASWVTNYGFPTNNGVYVDTSEMVLMADRMSYAIARRRTR